MLQVRLDHMAVALSKTFKSPIVDTIQSLPQHQQVINSFLLQVDNLFSSLGFVKQFIYL